MTDFLEGHIDPFDLDVFTPHLNGNLNRLVQRTSVSVQERARTPQEAALQNALKGSCGGTVNCLMSKDNCWHSLRKGKGV